MTFLDALKAYQASPNASGRAAIWASDIAPAFIKDKSFALGPILASNSLGTLYGDLVTQRALSLLKTSFPSLAAFSTDFSNESVRFGQPVTTRLRSIPGVSNYTPGTGYTRQNAVTTDVSVTIDQHKGVEISFNANELGSTNRDLFGEQAEGAHYALGKTLVDAIYALITPANFSYETVSSLSDFSRSKVSSIASTLFGRGVPEMGRSLLLSGPYGEKLGDDTSIVQFAAFQRPELITEYTLPRVAGFQPYAAWSLPTDDNLVGFAGTPDALAIATRVPADYSKLGFADNNGAVSVVTNPDTGISVQLVQYVDHVVAAAYWRVALMFGVAKGNTDAGERIVSTATGS